MVQSMDMVKLDVRDLQVICNPSLFNYGTMRDYCHNFSYSFIGGRSYGLLSECGAGAWTISYVLSGRTDFNEGAIHLNKTLANASSLKKYGWYIGDDLNIKKSFITRLKPKTIRQHILAGIKDASQLKLEEIIEIFGLSHTRLDRPIHSISNERWNASAAIGFAYNRKIYCFPWLNSYWIKRLEPRISEIINVLTASGYIVILPTNKEDSIRHLVHTIVDVPEPRELH
jgi:hypothetical protein